MPNKIFVEIEALDYTVNERDVADALKSHFPNMPTRVRQIHQRAIGYFLVGKLKWFFCKINRPILSPSLGMSCTHCYKKHTKSR